MRSGSGLHEACAALLAGVVVAACSDRGLSAGGLSARGLSAKPTQGAAGDAGDDDGPGTFGFQLGTDAAARSLAVSLSASATASCPGQCVELTAQIRGGIAPYTVRWSDGSTSGGGTREVCPTATTSYTAVVTDSSGSSGELPLPDQQAQASVTIAVTPSACAGAPDAGDQPASSPFPPTAPRTLCTASWDSYDRSGWGDLRAGNAAVALDPSGNIIVATSFQGQYGSPTSFGTLPGSAQGDADMIVIKLDAQCRVVWYRQYGATSAQVAGGIVKTDASGNIVLGGDFVTSGTSTKNGVDFGTGPQFASYDAVFVTKLDPNGVTIWVDTAVPPPDSTLYNYTEDLATDTSGNIVLVYAGNAAFGVSSDAGSAATTYELVKLDPGGNVVFAKSSDALAPAAWHIQSVDVARDGSIWAAGADQVTGDVRVVHVGGDGSAIASQVLPRLVSPDTDLGGVVRVSQTAGITVSGASGPGQSNDWTRWFVGLSPSASIVWTHPPILENTSNRGTDPAQLARVDGDGNTWIAGEFLGTQDLGAPVGALTSATNGSLELLILGPDGQLRSGSAFGGTPWPSVGDMALGPNRSVVLAGWDYPSSSSQTFTVTEIGF